MAVALLAGAGEGAQPPAPPAGPAQDGPAGQRRSSAPPEPAAGTDDFVESTGVILRLTDGLSDYGLVLAATPDGSLVYSNLALHCDFPRDVWPIFNFVVTAVCLYYKTAQDRGWAATQRVLDALFHAANAMPWGWPCSLDSLDGWIGHGHDYQDPLSMWTAPIALAGQDLKAAVQPGTLVQDILTAAG